MMLIRKPLVDARLTASRTTIPESITIFPYNGEYIAILAEAPQAVSTTVVTVNGLPRIVVDTVPNSGECRVKTYNGTPLPILEFNVADNGKVGTCDYYRIGSILTSAWVELEKDFVAALVTNYDTISNLTSNVPPQGDRNRRGFPGDEAILSDGSKVYSNGVNWIPFVTSTDFGS